MALIYCPECGKEISTSAKTCPHCGCEVTVCPDCNAVFTQKPEVCPNCGHDFNYLTHNENQNIQDDFRNYIKGKISLNKAVNTIQIFLWFIEFAIIIAAIVIYETLPKDDPLEYLYALSNIQRVAPILIISFCIIKFIDKTITILFNDVCNILHKLAANQMTLLEINGVKYCKEHRNTLNNITKKTTEWSFSLNAAYKQDDKSSDKYNILLIVTGISLTIIQVVCIAIVTYKLVDAAIAYAVWEQKFNWIESIDYIALIIYIGALCVYIISQKILQKKCLENLIKWSNSKSLPIT